MAEFKLGPKPVGLAAKKAAASQNGLIAVDHTQDYKALDPKVMADRIGIVFDDSGSMGGCVDRNSESRSTLIDEAHAGVEEFLRCCTPKQTAVTIYPMNAEKIALTADLITLAVQIKAIEATGSTPLVDTLVSMLKAEPLTRAIVFSDGQPDSQSIAEVIILSKEKKVAVDTVFFGPVTAVSAISFMRGLAEATGGVFLHFDPTKMNFRTAFKYLSPGFYGMLADKTFVSDLESGRKS